MSAKGSTKKLSVPRFKSSSEEAGWWDTHSTADLIDHGKEVEVKLKKPITHVFSVRLDSEDIKTVSDLAAARGVGFSTMLRMLVKDGLQRLASHPFNLNVVDVVNVRRMPVAFPDLWASVGNSAANQPTTGIFIGADVLKTLILKLSGKTTGGGKVIQLQAVASPSIKSRVRNPAS